MNSSVPNKKKKFARLLRWLVVLIIVGVVGAELVARYYLGLGDPPLSMNDPEIEYLSKPSQEVSRFGNRIFYNAYSMRSDDFPKEKQDERSLRIMVLGDSVINGGSQTDQSEIATELLKTSLAKVLDWPVTVGNISTGSWGPGNILAYLKRHGLFDADLVVLVISSHDAGDVPTFEPVAGVSADFPEHKPLFALQEVFTRYLPRYLPSSGGKPSEPAEAKDPLSAISDLEGLIEYIQSKGVKMLIAQHPQRDELTGPKREGFAEIAAAAESMGVPTIDLAPFYEQAIADGEEIYRDNIHPNTQGQRVIAEALHQVIVERLNWENKGTE